MGESQERITLNPCQGFGCHEHCILEVISRDGKIVRTQKGNLPGPKPGCKICSKGIMSAEIPYAEDRLLYPLKRKGERGEGKWERISWDQALDEIGMKLNEITAKYGPKATIVNTFWCGLPGADRSTNFDLAMRFIHGYGATRLEGPSVDMGLIYGSLIDWGQMISNSKYLLNESDNMIIIWGSNPIGFTRPGETSHMLIDAKDRGAKLVHISNLFDVTSAKVDQWVHVKSGTDAALALGMAHVLLHENLVDIEFMLKRTAAAYLVREDTGRYLRESDVHTEGSPDVFVFVGKNDGQLHFAERDKGKQAVGAIGSATADALTEEDAQGKKGDVYGGITPDIHASVLVNGVTCKTSYVKLEEHLAPWTPEAQEKVTGVSADVCEQLARDYQAATPATMFIYNGFRYTNSIQASRAVYLLTYLTGNVGNKGGTLLPSPLDYYPTTQLDVMPIWFPTQDIHYAEQTTLPEIVDSFSNSEMQQYKAFINPYSNPLLNWPNKHQWRDVVLPNLDLFVAFEIRMSDTCKYADYVLPEATIFERYEVISGPNDCITLCEPAIDPIEENRDCAEIWKGIAEQVGMGEFFNASLKDWVEFKTKLTLGDGSVQVAPLTKEEDPDHVGELAPITFERLEKAKTLHLNIPEEPHDNFTDITFETKSGKIEFYQEYLADVGSALADFDPAIILDSPLKEIYPLQFYPGRHKYFMQSQFTSVADLKKLALSTQAGVALNPTTAKERSLTDGDAVEVFNQRGNIRTTLHLREDIPPGMAHMWYSFNEDHYPGTDCPQTLATPLNARETEIDVMKVTSAEMLARNTALGIPRSAMFLVDKTTPEVFWDSLCEVRKVGD